MGNLLKRLLFVLLLFPVVSNSTQRYTQASGGLTSGNALTSGTAWSWTWAKSASNTTLQAGDTVWMLAGTYSYGTFNKGGSAGSPIVYRNYNNTHARIQASTSGSFDNSCARFTSGVGYIWLWGIEFFGSPTDRDSDELSGSGEASDVDVGWLMDFDGSNTGIRFINCVVHDTRGAVTAYAAADEFVAYGNIIYNYGFNSSDRGTGHAVYIQNDDDQYRYIENNILLPGFGGVVHAYGTSADLDSIAIKKNILAHNGVYCDVLQSYTLLYGGSGGYFRGDSIVYNTIIGSLINPIGGCLIIWPDACSQQGTFSHGYYSDSSVASVFSYNYCVSEIPYGDSDYHKGETVVGNVLYHDHLSDPQQTDAEWEVGGAYYGDNTLLMSRPTSDTVIVYWNDYETKRANVAAFNWDSSATISIPLSQFSIGDSVFVYNAQDLYADTPVVARYTGTPISVPMSATRWSPAEPEAWGEGDPGYNGQTAAANNPMPELGLFVVTSYRFPGNDLTGSIEYVAPKKRIPWKK